MRRSARSISAVLLSWAVICAALSCDDDDDGSSDPPGAPADTAPGLGPSIVRVVQASPDLPDVDVYVDDETSPLFSSVSYGDVTDFVSIPGHTHVLRFRSARGNSSSKPLFSSEPVTVPLAAATSLVAAGQYEENTHDKALRVVPVSESLVAASPGNLRVRVLHGGVDASRLDVDVDGDGKPDIKGLDRFEDSGEEGLELPADKVVRMQVTTDDPENPLTSFTLPPQSEGGEVLVVITGLLDVAPRLPNGFSLITADDEGGMDRILQDPVVYLLNTVSDPKQVDIFLDNKERVDSLVFGALSDRVQVSSESRSLDVFSSTPTSNRPGGTALVSLPTSGLKAGEQYLVVIAGPVSPLRGSSPRYRLLPFAEAFELDEDTETGTEDEQLRMRMIHAAPLRGAVDMGPLDAEGKLPSPAAADDLPFTQATEPEGLVLPPVEFTLGVRPSEAGPDEDPIEFFVGPGPLLSAGVFAVLAEDANHEPHLLLVSTAHAPWSGEDIVPGKGPQPVPPDDGDDDDDDDGDDDSDGGTDGGTDDGWGRGGSPSRGGRDWQIPDLPDSPALPSLPVRP
ncbi:DUF4397 domain-containing protein [Pyxidicoccus parkwayensis]|uniref:DUF4397 domain-containing protein n=1 Tax=Pyxidicoccus parkwayensis TaxID=2813578 RepID=A0ABX7P7M6_9BACT|nr:DUF4397 domain-containing protein [Pyxidicoccus parkwaysis]QSQ26456.1 DUF4397 domain-containing protein [Pyxidicoccus parkwaysis]